MAIPDFTGFEGRIRLAPWDERALGFRTAEIVGLDAGSGPDVRTSLEAMESWCRQHDVKYVYGRMAPDRDVRAELERSGYSLVETSLLLSSGPHSALPRVPRSLTPALTPAREEHVDDLVAIARDDFHHGRFLEDPWVSDDAARARNGYWIRDLVDEGIVMVAEHRGRIIGFHSDRIAPEGRSAQLILSGVRQGSEVFALPMWVTALSRLFDLGVAVTSTTVSATNVGVLNVYAALGFRVDAALLGYRKFLT